MKTKVTINGITYNIEAEFALIGKSLEQGFYTSLITLVRPNGHKEFSAMRDVNGLITII